MNNTFKSVINALLKKGLFVLCFYMFVNLVGCKQIHQGKEASLETPLAVIAIEPTTPAVLGLGEKLVVIIHYEPPASQPVQVWTRPYQNGSPVQGYRAHQLETVSREDNPEGIITGWFYFDGPTVIDETRVFMRDLSSREMIATHSYKIDAKWEGQPTIENTAAKKPHKCNHAKTAVKPKPTPCKNAKKNVKAKSPCNKSASVPQKTKRPPADTTIYTIDIGDSPVLDARNVLTVPAWMTTVIALDVKAVMAPALTMTVIVLDVETVITAIASIPAIRTIVKSATTMTNA